jgi:hypothetical protein
MRRCAWLRIDRQPNPIIGLLILEGPLNLNKLEELLPRGFLMGAVATLKLPRN